MQNMWLVIASRASQCTKELTQILPALRHVCSNDNSLQVMLVYCWQHVIQYYKTMLIQHIWVCGEGLAEFPYWWILFLLIPSTHISSFFNKLHMFSSENDRFGGRIRNWAMVDFNRVQEMAISGIQERAVNGFLVGFKWACEMALQWFTTDHG